jgi:hypothetical protein
VHHGLAGFIDNEVGYIRIFFAAIADSKAHSQ